MQLNRRQFLGASAATVVAAGTMASSRAFGANDRVAVGVMGINGRGRSHIGGFANKDGSDVVALCDVDKRVLEERAKQFEEKYGKRPKTYVDVRDMLADESIDAISIATPNHWHSLASIWACQAGKDVYVEKPLSHNIWEGRQLVAAAEKYGRVVQHGTQSRSSAGWLRDIKLMHEGFIGDIYMARALCYKRRDSIGFSKPRQPPAHLDWNLWQGPAQEQAYCANYVHYSWHWFWRYGNGDIGNQGVHQMDIAAWGLNKGLPVKVYSGGGRFTYEDQGETANTQVATMTYADGSMLVFEVRGRWTNDEMGNRVGNLFYGNDGYYVQGKGFFDKDNKPIPVEVEYPQTMEHFDNFIHAVRTRKQEDIHGTALEGHLSSAHCHLANVSYRVGGELLFDPKKERFTNSRKANKLISRDYRRDFKVPKLS